VCCWPFFHLELKPPVEQPYKFWEVEEDPKNQLKMSPDERSVVQHLSQNRTHTEAGRFAVPLPKKCPIQTPR